MKIAYIQHEDGQWLNENCYSSWYGFTRRSYKVIPFSMHDIPDTINRDTVVHGGINTIRGVFDQLGVPQPEIHNPQEYLPNFCSDRVFESTTISESLERNDSFFVKPEVDHKLFTGFPIKNFLDKNRLRRYDGDTKVLVSPLIDIVSEYRCFVNRGKLVGSKNYTGDFTKNIDYSVVHNAILEYKDQPVSYSIDFALLKTGETTLIEINDGFALGSYGLNPITYTRMITDRWNEIVGVNSSQFQS